MAPKKQKKSRPKSQPLPEVTLEQVSLFDDNLQLYHEQLKDIAAAREYLRIYPYMCVFPGLVITITSLAFNLLGDGLRDAIDPYMKT